MRYIHHRGAFGVARFDRLGNLRALTREASDRLAPRFFVYGQYIFKRFTEAASDTIRMIMENVMNYVAPQVELIEVVVECGFEGSTGGTGENMGWG